MGERLINGPSLQQSPGPDSFGMKNSISWPKPRGNGQRLQFTTPFRVDHGASFSVTSTGIFRVLFGKHRHEGPSCRAFANPPIWAEIAINDRPSFFRPCGYISLAGQPPFRQDQFWHDRFQRAGDLGKRWEIVRPQVEAG
jgi:hypothetical protein